LATPLRARGHDIVVVGASAGGVEALRTVVAGLPDDLDASIFVVLHLPTVGTSVLPAILSRVGPVEAVHAEDGSRVERGRIYVAPPGVHLHLEDGLIRLTNGPRENGHRPAIDPLFRSAARVYGPRVVGIVLSGVLDDGAAGLAYIKSRGGVALVQDPEDALYPMMPAAAIDAVEPDRVAAAEDLAALIVEYAGTPPAPTLTPPEPPEHLHGFEAFIEVDRSASEQPRPGEPSGFTCPECNGGLWETSEAGVLRFRCRTGHEYSFEALLADQSAHVEAALWSALRALEEKAAMTRRMAARSRERGHRLNAERFERRANGAVEEAVLLRSLLHRLPAIDVTVDEAQVEKA
jgi:two-component system chemotaxis response regulator CheB